MPIAPTDIAIFLISFAACAYCMVLSRRLKALQNTKDGLGATIVAFSDAMSAMSVTTKSTSAQVAQLAKRLPPLIEEANATCKKIEDTMRELDAREREVSDRIDGAHRELNLIMRHLLDESRERIEDMSSLMKQLRQAKAQPQPHTEPLRRRVVGDVSGSFSGGPVDHDLF